MATILSSPASPPDTSAAPRWSDRLPLPVRSGLKRIRVAAVWWSVATRPRRAARTALYRLGWNRLRRTAIAGVHLGSGGLAIRGFLNVDADWGVPCDVVGSVRRLHLADGTVGVIYASHLFEHVRRRDVQSTLAEWHRVLRPGGQLYLCVPDLEAVMHLYLAALPAYDADPNCRATADLAAGVAYGGQVDSFDFHYFGYSFATLRYLLLAAGFATVERFDRSALAFAPFYDGGYATIGDTLISLNVEARKL